MLKLAIRLTCLSIIFTSCVLQAPSNKRTVDAEQSNSTEEIVMPVTTVQQSSDIELALVQFDSKIRTYSQENASAILALDRFNQKSRLIGNTASKVLEELTYASDFAAIKTVDERVDFLENVAMKKVLEVVKLTENENLAKVDLGEFSHIHSILSEYKTFSKKLISHLDSTKSELNNTYAMLNDRLTLYKKYFARDDVQRDELAVSNGQTTANFVEALREGRSVLQSIKERLRNIVAKFDTYSDEQKELMLSFAANLSDAAIDFDEQFLLALTPFAVGDREEIFNNGKHLTQSYLAEIRDQNISLTRNFILTNHFNKAVDFVSHEIEPLEIDKLMGQQHKKTFDSNIVGILRLLDSITDIRTVNSTSTMITDRIDRIERDNLALKEKRQFLDGYKGTLLNQVNNDKENALRLMAVLRTFPEPPDNTDVVPEKIVNFDGLVFKIIFSQMISEETDNRADLVDAWLEVSTRISDDEYQAITLFSKMLNSSSVTPSILRNLRTALKGGSKEVLRILK